jgi:limonene-1,2-epoxide hydrolase
MPGEAQRVIEQFWKIQDSGDYTQLVELFAEDALLEDPVYGTYRGRAEIHAFMSKMVAEMGERKIHFTIDEICGDDHAVWSRWTMHSPAGTRGGCGVYKVANGKLTYYRDYMDPAGEE